MTKGNTLDVVVVTPSRLNGSSHIASSAAITYGSPNGSHPAMAALTVTSSTVASRCIGGSTPMASSVWNGVDASRPRTRAFGRREQREPVAPACLHGQLEERDGILVDADAGH